MVSKAWLIAAVAALACGQAVGQTQPRQGSYYWCEPLKKYYPDAQNCPVAWREVPAASLPAPGPTPAEIQRRREEEETRAAKKRIAEDDIKAGYKVVTISDFDLDKKSYGDLTKLKIHGFYMAEGNFEVLAPGPYSKGPFVFLLTEDAPRETRAKLQGCKQNIGCDITLLGTVVDCQRTYLGQPVHDERCLEVDGNR